jgi:uncharacterized membrane protein YkgB
MIMTKNMGSTDRILRTIAALVIVVLLTAGKIGGALAVILGIVAAAFLLTSAIGWCPAYGPLHISTRKKEQ